MAEIRSAGTLIGAIMESVGYHYQAQVLDVLGDPLTNEIGGLIYLVAIVIALGSSVAQGSFKGASWLLIGPPLFFATIFTRADVPNARWEFGDESRNQQMVAKGAEDLGIGDNASVSIVFAKYVRMISEVTKEIVRIVSGSYDGMDLDFILKAELFARIHGGSEFEPGLQGLIHYALVGQCGGVIQAARERNDPLLREIDFDDPDVQNGIAELGWSEQEYADFFQPQRAAAEEKFERLYEKALVEIDDDNIIAYLAGAEGERTNQSPDDFLEAMKGRSFSCSEIWGFVLRGLLKRARQLREGVERMAEDNDVAVGRLQNLIIAAHGQEAEPLTYNGQQLSADNVEEIDKIIAQYYLRNEISRGSPAAWLSHFQAKHNFRQIDTRLAGPNSFTEQARLGASEWAEKERLIAAATSMPYYQGLILYALGVSFPFFALLLLLPGKHGGFLLWFMLWMWAKSWDIGFAVVMLLDYLLFSMLSVDRAGYGANAISPEIGATFAALERMDPTFQLATHYSIIATSLLAIPVTMALLILGSVKGGAGLVAQGVERYAEHFAGAIQMKTQQTAIDNLKLDASEIRRQLSGRLLQESQQGAQKMINSPGGTELAPVPGAGGQAPNGTGSGQGLVDENNIAHVKRALGDGTYHAAKQRFMQRSGAAGFYGGLANPSRIFSESDKKVQALVGALAGPRQVMNSIIAKQEIEYTKDVWDATVARGDWVGDINAEARRNYDMMATFESIPIPWSGFANEPSEKDIQLELRAHEMSVMDRVARIKAADKALNGFWTLAKEFGVNKDNASTMTKKQRAKIHGKLVEVFKAGVVAGGVYTSNDELREAANTYLDNVIRGSRHQAHRPPKFTQKDVARTDVGPTSFSQRLEGDYNQRAGSNPFEPQGHLPNSDFRGQQNNDNYKKD